MRMAAASIVVGAMAALAPCLAQDKDPPMPPGLDPGGTAIALLSTGLDYTDPDIARRLARDGEGVVMGWDFATNDNHPFDRDGGRTPPNWGGSGSALAKLAGPPAVRLVPVRINPTDPLSIARAAAFVARTPARIVVVPMWSANATDWEPFRQAAEHFKDILFIAAAGDEGRQIDANPPFPAALRLANVLVVTAPLTQVNAQTPPNTGPHTIDAVVVAAGPLIGAAGEIIAPPADSRAAAVLAAEAIARCWTHLLDAHKGAALKAAVLAETAKAWPGQKPAVIERCVKSAPAKG
jgi:hypothetical protein